MAKNNILLKFIFNKVNKFIKFILFIYKKNFIHIKYILLLIK